MGVSIRELAALTGTSPTAVSLILNQRPHRYAKATVARVEEAAREHHYVPSSYAQTMRTKRFNNVFIVKGTKQWESQFPHIAEKFFVSVMNEHGIRVGKAQIEEERFQEKDFMLRIQREWQCDGFVFCYNYPGPNPLLRQLKDSRFPYVWYNQKHRFDSVRPDNMGGGRALAENFLRLGHQRIAFVCGSDTRQGHPDHYSVADRRAGYEAAMEEAGFAPRVYFTSSALAIDNMPMFRHWMSQPEQERPTAWICYDQKTAKCLATTALQLGLQVPQQCSLATIGTAYDCWDSGYRITYAIEYFDRMGLHLANMLVKKIEDPKAKVPTYVAPMDLRLGETSVPPLGAV